MIQIKSLRIEEFRGIRNLELTMDDLSFVIVGPNGSGKSGVVDAIDFVLTGEISRLSGAGSGGVSLTKHGPHVHQRDNPSAAKVSLTFTHATSGQTAVLTRCVKTAGQFTLEPNTPELTSAVAWAAEHSELTLSRREVMKYVNTEPGRRAQEVQALLKLDRIDETRRVLMAARNKAAATSKSSIDAASAAEDGVKRILDVTSLLSTEVAGAVNKQREILGLNPLTDITPDSEFSIGAIGRGDSPGFNKQLASRDLEALQQLLFAHPALDMAAETLTLVLIELEADPEVFDALQHRHLVEAGLPLVTGAACPLCDLSWPDEDALRTHLEVKLSRSAAADELRQGLLTAAANLVSELRATRGRIHSAQPHAVTLAHTPLQTVLQEWSDDLAAFAAALSTIELIREHSDRIAKDPLGTPDGLPAQLELLRSAIELTPDQTSAEAALSFLSVAQDRWTLLRQARSAATKLQATHKTATVTYDVYNSIADTALATLYKTVEHDFSSYYRQINSDDESSFTAGLSPTSGKLDLEVDFYGLGMFPPMAYHSEGHQDGMGVCLYLALIGQLLKEDFRLVVLDDVVTSVDANHRRQFCKLLKDVFPSVQFIITTHDEVWARQMQSSGLIGKRAFARFHGWTVDGGPVYGQGEDSWAQIDSDLAKNDVPGAAHKLRRNLEASLTDIAGGIQGQIIFRPDNNYELSSLFAAVKGRHSQLLKKAAASANSWNNEVAKQQVDELKDERAKIVLAQDGENWAINALVHSNDWATMTKADFTPVVDACRGFLSLFTCNGKECESWIYVVGIPGQEENLRCSCGSLNLNLRTK